MKTNDPFYKLKSQLEGDVYTDNVQKIIYATDASSYREIPEAVCKPKNKNDILKILAFAKENGSSIIPRGAGTSLAGQVVGSGIVVDISKYMNRILTFSKEEKWIEVEPGVVLGELNQFLAPHGLQFGPETSTANRCTMAGMLGNNSCGLHSLVYGSVREHVLEADVVLSDGSETAFKALSKTEFEEKCNGPESLLEAKIYRNIRDILSHPINQEKIRNGFPDPKVRRRNNGYAIDVLLESEVFTEGGEKFNFCKLLAGSEGTLTFVTKIRLNLIPLPPKYKGLVCAHFNTLEEAFRGNIVALRHQPDAIEMMDDIIMDCTKENIEQRKNRFFIEGDPKAMLMIEFSDNSEEKIRERAQKLEQDMRAAGYGYHFPLVTGEANIKKVWALRTAGLGLLSNIPGDKRSTTVIEDTAVAPDYLPEYIAEFQELLEKYKLNCVFYAHIATGELHLRPLLNLKDPADVEIYHSLAKDVAALVKKYRGSLSGEHGDGRLRGEFIPFMLGEHNYELIKQLKKTWDPDIVFNPGKIIDTPPITESLRYLVGQPVPDPETIFNFSGEQGLLRAIEKCNGSADCRKSELAGGSMCPSFMATRDEDKTTRGRANILREFLTRSEKANRFDHDEIYRVMDLCLSCKACKSECPSNVDMAKFKAEFLQHYYDLHGIPLRSRLIAYLPQINQLGMVFRPVTNLLTANSLFKKAIGFAPQRHIPALSKLSLRKWYGKSSGNGQFPNGKVYLYADEFTNYNESDIGIKAILLLNKLGYEVAIPKTRESGRTYLSKGLVRTAKKIATQNILLLKDLISEETPLIGIEPSAILSFRDEYPELVDPVYIETSRKLAVNSLLFEEFIIREIGKGKISSHSFTKENRQIKIHGHCQQKSIASTLPTRQMLELPENYSVTEITSGCCGMAGSFGYEKEHYELSMSIGELVLFPEVRKATTDVLIAAPGTSCRHHIADGTGKKAYHPVEILYGALV
ncbi:MAG: FAD-binding protein [Bacteroidetes bacterium GWF2_42_66]|nr:MAG: FAD-binding protein [Bacteroidetes bacterium GWA2_42_15]OFY02605.1 MAG: FAD-binding protein [Bacteroidetes bacterium GWE2_42_39]OFY41295.1 MAG: FAD-binding protein [Bacteroidetes bacterium GWF2_42_66]HBL75513.1 FAD-binding oxidoreductase [Prolixibacteraceae bacterium]HCR91834.1 FAD-binding oxidoreductase [Prolixibacteraceae bacterium]